MRTLIGIIAFVLWGVVSVPWYVCGVKGLCADDYEASKNDADNTAQMLDSANRIGTTAPQTEAETDRPDAAAPSDSATILAETDSTQALTKPEDKTTHETIALETAPDSAAKPEKEPTTTPVLTFDTDNMAILFPFGKIQAQIAENQKDNLKKLAQEIKAANATLVLTGHTDSIGSVERNMEVGKMRAEWTKQIFVSLGLNQEKIVTKSLGKTEATQKSAEGKNMSNYRRVDIEVVE